MSPVPSQRMTLHEEETGTRLSPEDELAQQPDDKQVEEIDEKLIDANNHNNGLKEVEEFPQIPGALPEDVIEQFLGEESDDDDEFFDADEFEEEEEAETELEEQPTQIVSQGQEIIPSGELPTEQEEGLGNKTATNDEVL